MRKRIVVAFMLLVGAGATLIVAAFATAGDGQNTVKADTLNGYQEGPAISSTGTGSFEAVIDDEAQTITYTLSYQNLEGGPPSQAHIHIGKRAENGGVSAFLCGGSGKPPCPPSGTVTGVIVPADVIGPASQGVEPGSFAELVRALRTGNTYANVHNTRWPGGEIRAQINDFDQRETG
jgi:hypothetical protein